MKCKKMTIETDGTTAGTIVKIDGKKLDLVQRVGFEAEIKDTFARIFVEQIKTKADGKVVTKNVAGNEKPAIEALLLEFDRS